MWYRISNPNEYIVITGYGIPDVKISKKAFVYPLQKASIISISPFDFEITLQAMTIEKLNFSLPAVFTIGPHHDLDSLKKYSMLLTGSADGKPAMKATAATGRSHVQTIVKGIIEGETRSIVSGMTMEEIFKERQIFKTKIIENVQSELEQFGLKIYNANVKELQDTAGSEYFKVLSRKAHEGASNQAKVDVASAKMMGEIGEAEKRGKTRQEISKIDAQTAVLETERKTEKAKADAELTTTEANLNMKVRLATIQATRQSEARDAELQKEVEIKRAEMELERRRAKEVVQAKIDRESAQQKSDAKLYTDRLNADGKRYQRSQEIEAAAFEVIREADTAYEATKKAAEAAFFKSQKDAEALLYRAEREADAAFIIKQKEAQGISELARAYGDLAAVLGPQGVLQYMMLQRGTYERLAEANASAIRGLAPKISVWTTGDEAGKSGAPNPIRDIFQSLPPLLSTVQEQTGILPPAWLAQMGPRSTEASEGTVLATKGTAPNGA